MGETQSFAEWKHLNRYFCKQWRPRRNDADCSILSGSALFAKKKSIFREWNTIYYFRNYNLRPLSIYNGPFWLNWIKLYVKVHWSTKGYADFVCVVNNFSVISGCFPVFLVWTSITKQRIKCLAQGNNTVPSVSLELAPLSLPLSPCTLWREINITLWYNIYLFIPCWSQIHVIRSRVFNDMIQRQMCMV